jgi:hypothetical protein
MTTLLDQAIVEAEALREAAFHSAEAAVIEKYSSQIKEAVSHILAEQDFNLDVEEEDEAWGPPTEEEEESEILDQVSTSVEQETAGMKPKVCLCPDEEGEETPALTIADEEQQEEEPGEETIVLDLARLEEQMNMLDEDLMEEAGGGYGKSPAAFTGTEKEEKEEIEDVEGEKALEEDITEADIKEALEEIAESLKVDIEPTKIGWGGTPDTLMRHKAKQMLAMLQSDEHKDDFEAMNKAVKELQSENKQLGKTIKNKDAYVEKLTEAVTMMKEILEESNIVNAKLLYKVRVLENNSLNERQKSHLAEKLSEAKSVEEAKLIFETLQSSVGSTKRHPESLSEAVERSSSAMLLARKRETTSNGQEPALDRWKTLAGLT